MSSDPRTPKPRSGRGRTRVAALGSAACVLVASVAGTRSASAQSTISTTFDPASWISPATPFELVLPDTAIAGSRVVIFVGNSDVTSLFRREANGFAYTPSMVSLPSGESEIVVYVVDADESWNELGRLPIRVRTAAGFERSEVAPGLVLNNQSQWVEGHSPDANRPPRDQFHDFASTLSVRTTHERGGWAFRTQTNIAGVSERHAALRFGERQDSAPLIDLSDYAITVERGPVSAAAGNVSFGQQRHLLAGIASRGLMSRARFGGTAEIGFTAMNGTTLVGWTNPFGIANRDNRVLAGTLGFELAPSRPGLLHVEGTVVNGRTRPQSGFTQGVISDAERSRGAGLRLNLASPGGRLRIESGLAWSRFRNPSDPLLEQGETVVPVRAETRAARYLDASLDVLRTSIAPTLPLFLTVAFRHERVDPLYRTIAMPGIRADVDQNTIEMTGSAGAFVVQAQLGRAHDNLDAIPTILSTTIHTTGMNVSAQLAALFGSGAQWLPQLTYGLMRVRQAGHVEQAGSVPDTYVPDQVTTNGTLGVQLASSRWRFGYQRNRSLQDNRQAERETSDFANGVDLVSIGFAPHTRVDIGLDYQREEAENREFDQTNRTRQLGATLSFRPWITSTLSSTVLLREATDGTGNRQRDREWRAEASRSFRLFGGRDRAPLQAFVRFTKISADPGVLAFGDSRRNWTLASGLSVTFF